MKAVYQPESFAAETLAESELESVHGGGFVRVNPSDLGWPVRLRPPPPSLPTLRPQPLPGLPHPPPPPDPLRLLRPVVS
jgi:hypothetical protein